MSNGQHVLKSENGSIVIAHAQKMFPKLFWKMGINRKIFHNFQNMDKRDIQILEILQEDATIGLAELAMKVNLSPTPCWRRLQKLREEGVICSQVVLCDPVKLNLGLTAFVTVRSNQHGEGWTRRFIGQIQGRSATKMNPVTGG